MPAKVTADYSQFPESIREVMPYVEGEVMELRNLWSLLWADVKKSAVFDQWFTKIKTNRLDSEYGYTNSIIPTRRRYGIKINHESCF